MVDPEFHEDVLAEFAAINMALTKALYAIAAAQPDRTAYLSGILEQGIKDLAKTNYWGLRPGRSEAVIEKAVARYSDIIVSLNSGGAPKP